MLKAPAAVFVSAGKTRPLELFDKSVFNHEPLLDNFIFLVWKFWSDGVNGRTNKINKTNNNNYNNHHDNDKLVHDLVNKCLISDDCDS